MTVVPRFALVFSIALLVFGSTHYYIWMHLVRDTGLPEPWSTVGTVAIIGLAVLMPVTMILSRLLPLRIARAVVWLSFCWMGLFFITLTLLAVSDLLRVLAYFVWNHLEHMVPEAPEHRLMVVRLTAGAVTTLALGAAGLALRSALSGPQVTRVTVHLPRLPASLNGFTIAQISDLHVAPLLGRSYVDRVVERVNALSPSLIAITGDLVDGTVANLGPAVAPLGGLKATHGVFFVTGNHEYYSGVDAWLQYIATLGIRPLRNERVSIGAGAESFDLAGIDDWTAHHFGKGHGADLQQALAGRDASRELVLLAHQPKAIFEAEQKGVGLMLSGHTHGGQIWPFGYLVRLQQPYVAGLATHGKAQIYVNRGTGYWGPPMRLGSPPEVTLIELRA